MISAMTTARPQQGYDHRLRELVQRTGNLTIATDLGVPRTTARAWLRTAPTAVVSLDVANLTELELRQEVLRLRRRPGRIGGCWGRERECPGRRTDHHGGHASGAGLHGASVLEFYDRGVVAVSQTSVALPPLARQRHHRPSTRGVLRRRTQPRAAAFGVSRPDAGRDVLRHGRCGPGEPNVRRGRRTTSARRGQPISGLPDVSVTRHSRMTPE